jgi:hypothetical protein
MKTLILAKLLGAAAVLVLTLPASAADPVCRPGFQQVEKNSYVLKCKKTVRMSQKGVALTLARPPSATPTPTGTSDRPSPRTTARPMSWSPCATPAGTSKADAAMQLDHDRFRLMQPEA